MLSAIVVSVLGSLAIVSWPQQAAVAHCQVPCGIYDDAGRIKGLMEDATTISKAITEINQLAGKHNPLKVNQATRWIMTKEQHASHIITTVSEYFLTQKVKDAKPGSPEYDGYLASLAAHHKVMRAAMTTKQTVDPEAAHALVHAIEALGKLYK
jgi:nickel superoxide dismutase